MQRQGLALKEEMNFACFAQVFRHLVIAVINLFRMGRNDPSPCRLVGLGGTK